jgi:hypothetical protein
MVCSNTAAIKPKDQKPRFMLIGWIRNQYQSSNSIIEWKVAIVFIAGAALAAVL